MATTRTCQQCGAVLPGHAAAWLCPKCLLAQASTPAPPDAPLNSQPSTFNAPAVLHYFGDYELIHEIARGGMGVVYKARQLSLNRTVAVKMLLFGKLAGGDFVKRFRAEAESAASLQHPNIVAIHEVGEHEAQQYFSMDYVEGNDLAALVREKPLPAKRAAAYLKSIAEAIHYAHQRGILHRDLKPSNILIDANDQPRITDFGLAKRLRERGCPQPQQVRKVGAHEISEAAGQSEAAAAEDSRAPASEDLTVTGQVLGTPHYMPPEQAGGKRGDVTPASDVYSLGAILYHLLTGRPPFLAETLEAALTQLLQNSPAPPRLLNPSVPRDLETICLKCLSKEPQRRYESAQALADDIGHWLTGEPIRARPVGPVEKLWRWCHRKPALAALVVALHLVGAAGLSGIVWQWRRAEHNAGEAVAKLRESYLAQARANRLSGRPGQRFDTLAAISNAVALGPSPVQRAQLRNQAIAALSLPDLVPVWTLENPKGDWNGGSIDLPRSRYALVTAAGRVEVRRVPDNTHLFNLPARDVPAYLPLDFSPDGKFLAICYTNSVVAVWDLEQRQVVLEEAGNPLRTETVAFSPDNARVAICARTPTVAVWDLSSRQRLYSLTNEAAADSLVFDPASQRLAIGLVNDDRIFIVDVATGARLRTLQGPHVVRHPAWHPSHPVLAAGCGDGFVRFWNPDTGEHTAIGAGESGECGGAAFNHRGDLLVNATWIRMMMWRPTVALSFSDANLEPTPISPAFRGIGNGSQLRFDAEDKRLSRTWWGKPQPRLEIDAISSAPEVRVFRSPRSSFEFLRFTLNHDGTLVALALTNAVQILDAETGVELARLPLPGARAPVFLPAQAGLVATSDQGLFAWSFQTGKNTHEIRVEPPRPISSGPGWTQLRLSPRGRRMAAWHDDHCHIYAVPDLQSVGRIGNHLGGAVLGPSFSADEEWLASTRWNNASIGIWQVAPSNLLHRINVTYSRGVTHGRAEFTPDGQWLFVSTLEDLRLYQPGSWSLRASLPWKSGANQQAFLGGGKVVAVVTDTTGFAVHLLTLPEFKELAVLETTSNGGITHLGTSGDGLKFFAVREDGEVNVWNLPLVAAGLQELGLDWDAPLPTAASIQPITPLRFRVERTEP